MESSASTPVRPRLGSATGRRTDTSGCAVRRSLCQLLRKGDTDLALLTFAIERNLDDTSFWLRKAIGWSLRQYARTDPAWVRAYVDSLGDRLSGLSRREATKHL